MVRAYHIPDPVTPRSGVRIASLSSPLKQDLLESGVSRLLARGWDVTLDSDCLARDTVTAGSREQRLAALARWRASPDSMLWNARGGYGTIELLDSLPARQWLRPRWVVGSSDTTALQLWLMAQGHGSLYAPMPSGALARGTPEATVERIEQLLAHDWQVARLQPHQRTHWLVPPVRSVLAQGPAVGGCLSLVAAMLGTPWTPDTEGHVLFLEDIGEHPFRIVRMLWHLRHAGLLRAPAAVVLGTFPKCEPPAGSGYTLPELLGQFFAGATYPVLYGYPFGHVEDADFCDSIVWGLPYQVG